MTSSQFKKVSVVVPNYNYGKYLRRRIKTILRQTYPIFELIILDDASTDNSEMIIDDIIGNLKVKYPELIVRFYKNKNNTGKAIKQWEKAFKLSSGDFVWIAEADDLSSRRFLEKTMCGFDDPDVVLSYTESEIINSAGLMLLPNFRNSRDREKTGHYANNYIKNGKCEVEEIMAIRCTIPNVSAVVFRKRDDIPYLHYLKEAERFLQVGDWYFYVKVLNHGKISYWHGALNKFRIHRGSRTFNSKTEKRHFDEVMEMHKLIMTDYNLNKDVLDRMIMEEKRIARRMGIDS